MLLLCKVQGGQLEIVALYVISGREAMSATALPSVLSAINYNMRKEFLLLHHQIEKICQGRIDPWLAIKVHYTYIKVRKLESGYCRQGPC